MPVVKICGITRPQDAEDVSTLGADFMGLIFAPSPRKLTLDKARSIMDAVPTFGAFVGVFQNETRDKVKEMGSQLGLSHIQLHGDEPPEDCRFLKDAGFSVLKTIAVKGRITPELLAPYDVYGFILDTHISGRSGGTGATFDWSLVNPSVWKERRVFLSGGLHPDNVREAIHATHPYGLDVSSGVERAVGIKDYRRISDFIERSKKLTGPNRVLG